MIQKKEQYIETTPGYLDDAIEMCKKEFGSYSHFCVRNGKAIYHILHLPDNSCGIYYAMRVKNDFLSAKRALAPAGELHIHQR